MLLGILLGILLGMLLGFFPIMQMRFVDMTHKYAMGQRRAYFV